MPSFPERNSEYKINYADSEYKVSFHDLGAHVSLNLADGTIFFGLLIQLMLLKKIGGAKLKMALLFQEVIPELIQKTGKLR